MKKAYILYKRADAEKNRVLINKYSAAFRRYGLFPSLVLLDRLSPEDVLSLVSDGKVVINRSRESGTARFLEESGVFVSNPAYLNETANSKLLTYERLHGVVPMLETHLLTGEPSLPFPFVAKPSAGHGGNGVTLVNNERELAAYRAAHPEESVIQPLATDLGRDMRVYVIGGKPAAAMLRISETDFRSNFSLGGKARFVPLGSLAEDEREIVESVSRALPLDYAGVDIMHDRGRAILNEIEDPVGARMLYMLTDIDPAEEHVRICLAKADRNCEK